MAKKLFSGEYAGFEYVEMEIDGIQARAGKKTSGKVKICFPSGFRSVVNATSKEEAIAIIDKAVGKGKKQDRGLKFKVPPNAREKKSN